MTPETEGLLQVLIAKPVPVQEHDRAGLEIHDFWPDFVESGLMSTLGLTTRILPDSGLIADSGHSTPTSVGLWRTPKA
jgi:hypothetical protein